MIHYDKRATVEFINRLYTLLTQRRVQQPPERKAPPKQPPFAKGTASLAVKQRLRDPEMTDVTDTEVQRQKIEERLGAGTKQSFGKKKKRRPWKVSTDQEEQSEP